MKSVEPLDSYEIVIYPPNMFEADPISSRNVAVARKLNTTGTHGSSSSCVCTGSVCACCCCSKTARAWEEVL